MSEARASAGRSIAVYLLVTLVVAVAGAAVGWMLGSVWMGAVFGAGAGYFGCVLGGFVSGDGRHRVR